MKASPSPFEAERLSALRALDILDTPREEDFDEIVELASRICEAPISVINLIDEHRQWFKAETGLGVRETPLDTSICAHVILEPGLTIIPDTLKDARMSDNPLCLGEPHLRFYAGALLKTDDGQPIGTLCVLDHTPRDLSDLQRFALDVLAKQVMTQLKLRKLAATQTAARQRADEEAEDLRQAIRAHDIMVQEIDHRVKNSLNTVAAMLNLQSRAATSETAADELSTARDRVLAVAAVHEQLHMAARYDKVDMPTFMARLVASMKQSLPENILIKDETDAMMIDTRTASTLGIIVNELVTNSIKHAFPDEEAGEICIDFGREGQMVTLDFWDTGVGMRPTPENGKSKRLGMRVVSSSVDQLEGKYELLDNQPGVRIRISVPVEDRA